MVSGVTENLTKREAQQKENEYSKEEQECPEISKKAYSRKWSKVTREFTRREEEKSAEIIKDRKRGKEDKKVEAQDFKPKMQVAVLSRKVIKVSYKSKKMSEIKGAAETGAKLIREKEEEKVSNMETDRW